LLLAILLELLFFPNYAKRYGKVAEERCICAERKRQVIPSLFFLPQPKVAQKEANKVGIGTHSILLGDCQA